METTERDGVQHWEVRITDTAWWMPGSVAGRWSDGLTTVNAEVVPFDGRPVFRTVEVISESGLPASDVQRLPWGRIARSILEDTCDRAVRDKTHPAVARRLVRS